MNIERLESDFQRLISKVIQFELKNPKIGFVTITDVKITNDLSFATIYFTTIAVTGRKDNAKKALDSSIGYIKKQISQKIKIRKIPNLIFKYDESLDNGNKIDKLLMKSREHKSE